MDEDLWHVRIAPDEVKQLTLEQLDDLFRLEVIEADTLLWQPGMTEWLPLSVVAGLDDDGPETEKVSIPVSAPPPAPARQMAQTATAWPPRVAAPVSGRPAHVPTRPAPPPSLPPPPPARTAAAASSWPPPAAWSNPPPKPRPSANPYAAPVSPYAATIDSPGRSGPPPSTRPVVVSPFASPSMPAPLARTQRLDRRSGGGGGGWLVFLAFAAGAAVTLYRNDLVHAAARSVGHESSYFELERALGGPSFGTPRAVEQMAAAAAALSATSEAATANPPASPTSTSTPGSSAPSTLATSTTATTSAPTTTSATTTQASDNARASDTTHETTHADTTNAERAAAHTEPAVAKSSPVKAAPAHPAPATHSASTHASASSRSSASDDVDPVFKTPKQGKKAGKASEYDPLNPSL